MDASDPISPGSTSCKQGAVHIWVPVCAEMNRPGFSGGCLIRFMRPYRGSLGRLPEESYQAIAGRVSISQKIASTAVKAGKPKANQMR